MSFIISSKKFKNNIPKSEITFASTNILHQSFRYPKPIMNYLKAIPTSMTPKLYINLLKSCKYFYSKKDLLIPLNDSYRYELWKIISSKKEPTKFKLPFKIWLTRSFWVAKLNDCNEMYFLKYVARCNIINIQLQGQKITFKEFELLIKNGVERFHCHMTIIKYCNGIVVPIDVIFAYLKSVKYVYYTFDDETAKLVTAETAKELTKEIDTSKLEEFYLERIPSTFDFEIFSKFTQTHEKIHFFVQSVS